MKESHFVAVWRMEPRRPWKSQLRVVLSSRGCMTIPFTRTIWNPDCRNKTFFVNMTASVAQLEKSLRLLENEKRPTETTNKDLIMKNKKQNKVSWGSLKRLVNSFTTRSFGMAECISRSIWKWCLRELSTMVCASEDLRRNWARRFERSFESDMDTGRRDRLVPLYAFSRVEVSVYKRSLTFQTNFLVGQAETHFESSECAKRLCKRGYNTVGFKGGRRQRCVESSSW